MSKKIHYLQRLVRTLMRLLGRIFLPALARIEIEGIERFPHKGPLIVVGNHTGALEVVLLTVYAPRVVEYLGSIDIPHEAYIAPFIHSYGFIPIFRGNASRESLEAGLEVLRQGATLGLFPEGGIWEPAIRRAQSGVAWLSYRGDAPILPIGFGSTRGALSDMLRLKRPNLSMRVGEVLPPVQVIPGAARKRQLQEAATRIVEGIWALVPEDERPDPVPITDETFELVIEILDASGATVLVPETLSLKHGSELSKVIHRTTLFNNLLENLRLPVASLKVLHTQPALDDLLIATNAILDYLETDNPYYFTYRYGPDEGAAMRISIHEFQKLLAWVNERGYTLHAIPLRRFRRIDTAEFVTLRSPQEEDKW